MDLVFDFGGVLFTWEPARLVAQSLHAEASTPAAAQALAQAIFGHADWGGFDAGTLTLEEVVQRTALRLALPSRPLADMLASVGDHLTPIPGSVALLAQLRERRTQHRDVRLYYLSNMPAPYAGVLLKRNAFLQWFDGGIFSSDVHLVKPGAAIFGLLAQRYGLQAGHTAFIDDMLGNVEAARNLGWHGIHFQNSAQVAAEVAAILSAPRQQQ